MKKYTHCDICLAACGMEVDVEGDQIVSIRGDVKHPLTRGFLCLKGLTSHELMTDPLRLRHPYKRAGDKWDQIRWEEAYSGISQRLREIISRHGPNSVAMYYGAGNPTSSMNFMLADGFLRALGSDRMYNVLTLEFTNRHLVMERMYGKQFFMTQPDLDRTSCLLIFGSNPMISLDHPGIVASLRELKRRGGKIFVVDPRRTETAELAEIHAPIIPGTDLYMLLALHGHIFRNRLHDPEFLSRHCTGHESFQGLSRTTPGEAAEICGVPADVIVRIAEEFAKAESACAICKLGINTSSHGTLTYWLVEALNAVTGNVDRPGGLLFNPGILDLNLLSRMSVGRKKRKSRIGGYPYLTGSYPASEIASEILMDSPDRIRALIVDAGDPSLVFPNSKRFQEAMDRLDLLVSIDMYMNETARRADYVLPAASFLEKDDLYVTFPDHHPFPFAQWKHKVVEPRGESRPEWRIFRDLSRCMGVPILNQWPMEILFRAGELLGQAIGKPDSFSFDPKNYYRLLLGTMGKVKLRKLMENPHGVKGRELQFGDALEKMATPSRKIDVAPGDFVAALKKVKTPRTRSERFPLILISGERSPYTKNTNLRGTEGLTKRQSSNSLRISSEDAASLSVCEGDRVEITTHNGSLTIQAKVTSDIRPGVVSLGHGWGRKLIHPEMRDTIEIQGQNVNLLTGDANLDELSGMPVYNGIPCVVRKCRSAVMLPWGKEKNSGFLPPSWNRLGADTVGQMCHIDTGPDRSTNAIAAIRREEKRAMAKVYYMDDRSQSIQTSLVAKMLILFDAAGFGEMIKPGEVVAVKVHMGEYNNTAYLRPVYVRALVEKIRSLGGEPMVVDTTTLPYHPHTSRSTALDYLNTVARNGFTHATVGCPIVIADGYFGTDDVRIDLPEGFILQEQYVATGVALADAMIVLSHFKGHPMGTYGGAIKNIGVGCASKRGKLNLHMGGHPRYGLKTRHWMPERCLKEECPQYQVCLQLCPTGAIRHTQTRVEFDRERCIGCLACIGVVTMCGVAFLPDDYFDVTAAAIADSALAAAKAVGPSKVGYINMALDITPWCDCVNYSDRPIVPNLGLFVSWDPVAVDSACIQRTKDSAGMPDSLAMTKGTMNPGTAKFSACGSFLGVSEEIQPNVGQKIGLGSRQYELEEVQPPEDVTPFLCTPVPAGAKLGNLFAKKGDVYPGQGYKRLAEVDIEDMR